VERRTALKSSTKIRANALINLNALNAEKVEINPDSSDTMPHMARLYGVSGDSCFP
jgi:hypothetical protein